MKKKSRRPAHPQQRRHRRGGYLYIAIMAVATIVSIIGFSAMTVARIKLKNANSGNERTEAMLLSLSAIEYAMAEIDQNASWRTTFVNNIETPSPPLAVGNGTVTFKIVDIDGSLADNVTDIATVYGIGRVGSAVHVQKVVIQPAGSKMEILLGSWQQTTAP